MKKTQFCMKCGQQLDLDFEEKWKHGRCPACKVKFKYRLNADGSWSYDYKAKESDIFKEVKDGGALHGSV